MKRIFILLLVFVLSLSPTPSFAQTNLVNCTISGIENDAEEIALFSKVNQWRMQNKNAPPMELSTPLNRAAQWMAREVDNRVNSGHVDSSGRDWPQRFLDCGYSVSQGTGESIKVNASADQAFDFWVGYTGNGMHAPVGFKCAGVGHYGNSWTVTYAVAVNGTCPGNLGGVTPYPGTPTKTPTPSATPNPDICTDSDQGLNYNVKGVVKSPAGAAGSFYINTDACYSYVFPTPISSESVLTEYYCENNVSKNVTFNCPGGCSDGKCIGQALPTGKLCRFNSDCPSGYFCPPYPTDHQSSTPIFACQPGGGEASPTQSISATVAPTNTPNPNCDLKPKGDATCDGKVNPADFIRWKREYTGEVFTQTSDFNGKNGVDSGDFIVWKNGYLDSTIPH